MQSIPNYLYIFNISKHNSLIEWKRETNWFSYIKYKNIILLKTINIFKIIYYLTLKADIYLYLWTT